MSGAPGARVAAPDSPPAVHRLSLLSVTDAAAARCLNHVGIRARKRSFNVSSGIHSWSSADCSHTSAKRSRAAGADAFPA
ncbi:hypothetical protein BVIET440_50141 [Burkholderia vietnamiensis]